MYCESTDEETWFDWYGVVVWSRSLLSVNSVQGDRIIVVVQKSRSMGDGGPNSTSTTAVNKVRRGDVRHAIIVRTKKKVQRKDGMVVRYDDNACALIGKNGEPIGTRINGECRLCMRHILEVIAQRLRRSCRFRIKE